MEGVRQYGSRANALGHQIEVLTLDDPKAEYLNEYPLKVHAIGPSVGKYAYNSRLKPWVKLNAGAYDAIIINGLWMYHGFGAWRALKETKVPYFVFTHGMLDPWFKRNYPLKHLKKWLYWPWADYRVLRDAKRVLFTCEQERILARQSFCLYSAKEAVVNYGAGSPPAENDEDIFKDHFRSEYPELANKRIVLFLSRVHEKKGCDLLIEAFANTCSRDNNLQLVIAGPCDESLKSALKTLATTRGISDRVTWTGMLTGNLKWGAFYCADVFALISHQENFGIAVAEALASGTPVLISDQVNIWREIKADSAGIVGTDTVEGATDLLNKWLDLTLGQQDQMRVNARLCFKNRFTAEAMADSITGTIKEAITE